MFTTLLSEVRRKMAEKYLLEHTDFTFEEVAFLLGYSEASAFHRAFKKWTGLTPGQFAKQRV